MLEVLCEETNQMAAMNTLYNPLQPKQIRLITVSTLDGIISCQMETAYWDQTKYDALSYSWAYSWEGAGGSKPITVNGIRTIVGPNLFEFLKARAEPRSQPSRAIWTDALCLNQDDEDEKKVQVPLMDQIYHGAKTVVIWLGPGTKETDKAMERATDLGARLERLEGKVRLNPERLTEIEGLNLPDKTDALWIGLGQLCRRDWWERTWVIQEAVLAQSLPVLMCGNYAVGWREFDLLLTGLMDTDLKNVCLKAAGYDLRQDTSDGFTTTSQISRARQWIARHGSYPFLPLLQMTRLKGCGVDVDRIFGTLGMVPSELRDAFKQQKFVDYPSPQWLGPNIRNQAGNYELFIKVAKYYFPYDFQLLTLSMAASQERPARLPTWCPNWNSPQPYTHFGGVQSYHAGFTIGAIRRATVYTSTFSDRIVVSGFRVDVVDKVVEGFFTWSQKQEEWTGEHGCAAKLTSWSTECLKLAQEVYSDESFSDAYWRTLTGNKKSDAREVSSKLEDFWLHGCISWRSAIKAYTAGMTPEWKEGEELIVRNFQGYIEAASKGRKFFSTKDGRIGLGPPNIQSGDIVSVLLSGGPAFILRYASEVSVRTVDAAAEELTKQLSRVSKAELNEPQSDLFQQTPANLIGDAYVHGIMYGEGLSMETRKDELFLIA